MDSLLMTVINSTSGIAMEEPEYAKLSSRNVQMEPYLIQALEVAIGLPTPNHQPSLRVISKYFIYMQLD
jgi:hypothetical protein